MFIPTSRRPEDEAAARAEREMGKQAFRSAIAYSISPRLIQPLGEGEGER